MTTKPTSGERIAAFMQAQQLKPRELWIEVWFVPAEGGFSWRASEEMTKTDCKDTSWLWETYHVLQGKQFKVVICSHWRIPFELSVSIADDIVKGRTVRHRLIIE